MPEDSPAKKPSLLIHGLCVGVCTGVFMVLFKSIGFDGPWYGFLGGGVGGAAGYLISHGLLTRRKSEND